MAHARRSFLKLLASGFAAVVGVKIGDARADQRPMTEREFVDFMDKSWAHHSNVSIPTTTVEVQDEMSRCFRGVLEAGSRVGRPAFGHEPNVLPLHHPASNDTHDSTK